MTIPFINDGDGSSRIPAGGDAGSSSSGGTAVAPPSTSASGLAPGPSGPVMHQIKVSVAAGPAAANCTPYQLSPGERVYVAPVSNNAADILVATNGLASSAQSGPNERMPANTSGTPREVSVQNLAQIWVFGTAGDSILVTVRK